MTSRLALALLLVLLAACGRAPDEQRLRDTIATMQGAVEAGRPGEFMEGVAEDFIGEQGLDRDGLRRLLQVHILRNRSIGVSLGPIDVEVHGERATVRFELLLTGGEGWVPDRAGGYAVVTGWRVHGGGWQVYHAQWTPRF